MRRVRKTAAVAILAVAASCATGGEGGVMSPYATPEGTDLVYRYGSFCGPAVPTLSATTPAERIVELRSIAPQDDIDVACQVHDICYEIHGHDEPGCDLLMQSLLAGARPESFDGPEPAQCTNQVREIAWGFEVGSAWDAALGPLAMVNVAYSAAVVGATAGPMVLAQQAGAQSGFPSAPGVCSYTGAHRASRIEDSREILAQLEAARLCYAREEAGERCNLGRERDRLITTATAQELIDTILGPDAP